MAIDEDNPLNRYALSVSPQVPPDVLFTKLSDHLTGMSRFLAGIPEDKVGYAYAPGKWTVRQLVGHLWVSQRIFVTRAVAIARGETQALPGYDENLYSSGWPGSDVTLEDLTAAYTAEAKATQIWLLMVEEAELLREGTVNGKTVRPEQILRGLIGHETHHRNILIERYGIEDKVSS